MTTTHHNKPPVEKSTGAKPSLMDAVGVPVGKSIEWAHGNTPTALTEREKQLIREKCRVKSVNVPRCLQVKQMLVTMTPAQVVKKNKGRKGFGERTVYGIHAALSQARGEGKR